MFLNRQWKSHLPTWVYFTSSDSKPKEVDSSMIKIFNSGIQLDHQLYIVDRWGPDLNVLQSFATLSQLDCTCVDLSVEHTLSC